MKHIVLFLACLFAAALTSTLAVGQDSPALFMPQESRTQNAGAVHLVDPSTRLGGRNVPISTDPVRVQCPPSGRFCTDPQTGAIYTKTRLKDPRTGEHIYSTDASPMMKFARAVQVFTEMIVGRAEHKTGFGPSGGKG